MKKVKRCPNCGAYSKKVLDKCEKCGFKLDSNIFIVEDDIEYDPLFNITEPPVAETKEIVQSANETIKLCPRCKMPVSISDLFCPICNKPLLSKPVEDNSDSIKIDIPQAPSTIKLRLKNPEAKLDLEVDDTTKSFGRYTIENVFLNQSLTISRTHFKYTLKGSEVVIIDYSTNGTWLNGKKLTPQQEFPVHSNDVLTLANVIFEIEYVG